MNESNYGFGTDLTDVSLSDARARVVEALAAEGFGVLTEIDMKATLKKKLDVDVDPYVILGACNPQLAYQALQADSQIGLLLPCNVVLQEQGDCVALSIANPRSMFGSVEGTDFEGLVADAEARLRRVVETVS